MPPKKTLGSSAHLLACKYWTLPKCWSLGSSQAKVDKSLSIILLDIMPANLNCQHCPRHLHVLLCLFYGSVCFF